MNSFNRNARPEYRQVTPQWSPKSSSGVLEAVGEKLANEKKGSDLKEPIRSVESGEKVQKVSKSTETPPNSPNRRFVLKSSYESPISFT